MTDLIDYDLRCPSIEMLAAYVDDTTLASSKSEFHVASALKQEGAMLSGYVETHRALTSLECVQISEHLNYCPRCYELVCETREAQRMMHEDQESTREEYQRLYLQETRVERTHED